MVAYYDIAVLILSLELAAETARLQTSKPFYLLSAYTLVSSGCSGKFSLFYDFLHNLFVELSSTPSALISDKQLIIIGIFLTAVKALGTVPIQRAPIQDSVSKRKACG